MTQNDFNTIFEDETEEAENQEEAVSEGQEKERSEEADQEFVKADAEIEVLEPVTARVTESMRERGGELAEEHPHDLSGDDTAIEVM